MNQETSQFSSLGLELRQAREKRGVSLKAISNSTKIREEYLQALEDDNYDIFPSRAYLIGFLKNYVKHVDLELEPLIQKYRPNVKSKDEISVLDRLAKQKIPKVKKRSVSKKRVAFITILLLLLISLISLFMQSDLWAKISFTNFTNMLGRAKDSVLTIININLKPKPPMIQSEATRKTEVRSLPPPVLKVLKGNTIRLFEVSEEGCWVTLKKFIVDVNGEEKLVEYPNDVILKAKEEFVRNFSDKSEIIEVTISAPVEIEFNQKPFPLQEGVKYPLTLRIQNGNLSIR